MTTKAMALDTIKKLPDTADFDDIMYALYVKAKFEKGETQIKAGRGIPHEQAKQRLAKWAK